MRVLVIREQTTGNDLADKLVRGKGGSDDKALASLQHLNPHVNFAQIKAGTVLVIPDEPGFRDDAGARVEGDAFGELRAEALKALDAAAARVRSGHDRRLNEGKEMTAVLRSAQFKRAAETDQELKAQAEAAAQVFRQDQTDAKTALENLKLIEDQAKAELDALAKLLA
jgi:hypothetical protein